MCEKYYEKYYYRSYDMKSLIDNKSNFLTK